MFGTSSKILQVPEQKYHEQEVRIHCSLHFSLSPPPPIGQGCDLALVVNKDLPPIEGKQEA
jgi:hypothetical protein